MCGIFAVSNDQTNHAAQTVLTGLKKLEYRGYDSWGIAIKPKTGISLTIEKHIGKIGEAKTILPQGNVAIGHTRWATHGGVTDANAHPHLDCSKQIAVLHNGIVENFRELKEKLVQKGHCFISETDTEVISHLIEEYKKEVPFQKAVLKTFRELVGSNAIAVLDLQTEIIIACRNGSPLVVGVKGETSYLASDIVALLSHTQSIYYVLDGECIVLAPKKVQLFDIKTGFKKKLKTEHVDLQAEEAEKGSFPHFLLKEIYEQKVAIPKALSLVELEKKKQIKEMIKKGYRIMFTGCGTAYYCCLASTYLLAEEHIESQAFGSYELLPFLPFINDKTILIAVSQSGETADTLEAVKQAKKKGAFIISILNARGSTLERLSDMVFSIGAGPEIAVVSTKAFTAQLATIQALFSRSKDMKNVLDNWLNQETESTILSLSKKTINQEHAYAIGKHINYPAALEFALKLKETSYIHAEAFSSGELKHGVLTLIQKGTPCFVLTANDNVSKEVLSSAMELKSRGGTIIGIGPKNGEEFDYWIKTPDMGKEYSIYFNVIVGQLLGYFLGIGRGTDPDKPRNLAKSVTVK